MANLFVCGCIQMYVVLDTTCQNRLLFMAYLCGVHLHVLVNLSMKD